MRPQHSVSDVTGQLETARARAVCVDIPTQPGAEPLQADPITYTAPSRSPCWGCPAMERVTSFYLLRVSCNLKEIGVRRGKRKGKRILFKLPAELQFTKPQVRDGVGVTRVGSRSHICRCTGLKKHSTEFLPGIHHHDM